MDESQNPDAEPQGPQAQESRIIVRNSRDADVPAMLAIYLITSAAGRAGARRRRVRDAGHRGPEAPPQEMQKRKMPHIVAEENGVVLGYAYAVPFRKRPAYRYAIKHSIYVHMDHLQRGVGGT